MIKRLKLFIKYLQNSRINEYEEISLRDYIEDKFNISKKTPNTLSRYRSFQ